MGEATTHMKQSMGWFGCGLVSAMCLGVSGCAVFWLGAGAVGGYAVSRDTVTNTFELPVRDVYAASRQVVRQLGFITSEDEHRGHIRGTVDSASLTVTIKPISERLVELKVKARRHVLPKIDIAQRVYNAIIDQLPR